MFLGTHTPKLDDKGRFFLPAKFRDELAAGLVITRSQDRCLAIYPMATFVTMTQSVSTAPATLKQVRDFQRMLAAGASDEVPDKQGRVTIPPALRSYAGLDKEIVVVGAINRVEIWDSATWESYSAAQEDVFADMNGEILVADVDR
ncbi:division/cell wall cluster transcriptional repressor MraZ [Propionibacterium australiense]|uniref:Transcriptional regulator MraZ n=1 Tax=Propionibacterium australiense TaxID=119981 RepID=A0A383S406_9ACTN|nr:division/cell wall cluster transcriptional repressor MraZ [Propionibacterium australiense]RLP11183.1 transcriptional regulator MraZ [Propionibacterium australiense]RLP12512.1 transcriptional regulator MraZ [Propionibacterium australiense]SYZ32667.1 Transcriptional regulator MraZ [mraZ] [Propionibacterium australiense]